jgi:hypothetical protein
MERSFFIVIGERRMPWSVSQRAAAAVSKSLSMPEKPR